MSATGLLFPADLRPTAEAFVAPFIECAESQYPSLAVASLKGLGALVNTLRPLDRWVRARPRVSTRFSSNAAGSRARA